MKISIITTLYCSESYIAEFYSRLIREVLKITNNYELIFVNDGSPDDSINIALELRKNDSNIKIIDLSRNFGHHQAIFAGLCFSSGDEVFLIDCDLEEPPELINKFHKEFNDGENIDVVYGIQKNRKGGVVERFGGVLFYKLFNKFSGFNINRNVLTIRMMSKRYVDTLKQFNESELFMAGIFEFAGYRQKSIIVEKKANKSSTYSLKKRFNLMVTGLTSFSSFLLLVSFYIGLSISGISFLMGLYFIARKVIGGSTIELGWTSIMVSIWFVGGILLVAIGVLGLYLSKIYNEVKNRPNYIIRDIYEK